MLSTIKAFISEYVAVILAVVTILLLLFCFYLKYELKSAEVDLEKNKSALIISQASVDTLTNELKIQNAAVDSMNSKYKDILVKQKADLDKYNKEKQEAQKQIDYLTNYKFTGNDCADVHNLVKDLGK